MRSLFTFLAESEYLDVRAAWMMLLKREQGGCHVVGVLPLLALEREDTPQQMEGAHLKHNRSCRLWFKLNLAAAGALLGCMIRALGRLKWNHLQQFSD